MGDSTWISAVIPRMYVPTGSAFRANLNTKKNVGIWPKVEILNQTTPWGRTHLMITRERKFILGNARGEVAVYNFRNGAKMKDLDTQAGPIAGLVYCAREKAVLVACQVRTEN